jgi:hypothetical protein
VSFCVCVDRVDFTSAMTVIDSSASYAGLTGFFLAVMYWSLNSGLGAC